MGPDFTAGKKGSMFATVAKPTYLLQLPQQRQQSHLDGRSKLERQSVPAGVFRGDSKATVFLSLTSLSGHNAYCHFMKERTLPDFDIISTSRLKSESKKVKARRLAESIIACGKVASVARTAVNSTQPCSSKVIFSPWRRRAAPQPSPGRTGACWCRWCRWASWCRVAR